MRKSFIEEVIDDCREESNVLGWFRTRWVAHNIHTHTTYHTTTPSEINPESIVGGGE